MTGDRVVKLDLPSRSRVEPSNLPVELQTVNAILDFLDTQPAIDQALGQPLEHYGEITPWVALQLGCVAELQADQGQVQSALVTAFASVNAALRCHDPDRLLANLLTVGGIYLRLHDTESAAQVYRELLELPVTEGLPERASAHASLASILSADEPREAVHHFEQAVCCLADRLSAEMRDTLLRAVARAYHSLEDWVGVAYVCHHFRLQDVQPLLRQLVTAGNDVTRIIAADTRFRKLGADELADQLFQMWSEAHATGESHE